MIIKIMGPVGSGKSTVSKLLASYLSLNYIPEMADNDITFFRLLQKRNTLQTEEAKLDFQCYTFEQAYKRQYNAKDAVIDVPVVQHFIMAKASLSKESFEEYYSYYNNSMLHTSNSVTFILKLSFEETLERIKSRGRKEEKLSNEEIGFYRRVYEELYSYEGDDKDKVVIIDESQGSQHACFLMIQEVKRRINKGELYND